MDLSNQIPMDVGLTILGMFGAVTITLLGWLILSVRQNFKFLEERAVQLFLELKNQINSNDGEIKRLRERRHEDRDLIGQVASQITGVKLDLDDLEQDTKRRFVELEQKVNRQGFLMTAKHGEGDV